MAQEQDEPSHGQTESSFSWDRVMKLVFWMFLALVALFALMCWLDPDTDTPPEERGRHSTTVE